MSDAYRSPASSSTPNIDSNEPSPSVSPDHHVRFSNATSIIAGFRNASSIMAALRDTSSSTSSAGGSQSSSDDIEERALLLVERATDRRISTPYWEDITKYSPEPLIGHFGNLKFDASYTRFKKAKQEKKGRRKSSQRSATALNDKSTYSSLQEINKNRKVSYKSRTTLIEDKQPTKTATRKASEPKSITKQPYNPTILRQSKKRKQTKEKDSVPVRSNTHSVIHIKHSDLENTETMGQSMFGAAEDIWVKSVSPVEIYRKTSLLGTDLSSLGLDISSFQFPMQNVAS